MTDADAFRGFVSGRLDQLRRTAYLLCGDWHLADDIVSTALARLYRHWPRMAHVGNLDGYVRRVLVRSWLNETRRPWRRERPAAVLPERASSARDADGVVDRMAMVGLLAELPPRRRAVVVLRYCNDLSVDEVAEILGCSAGTVKSQSARALDTLRTRLGSPAEKEC